MKLEAFLDDTGNIDVCYCETGEVLAIFKGTYYDIGKKIIDDWIEKHGFKFSHKEYGWDNLILWVTDK